MKYLIAFVLASISTQGFAEDGKCKSNAEKVAMKLDQTTVAFLGPFQGDADEPNYSVKLVNTSQREEPLETYHAIFRHENDELEFWDFNYEIELDGRFCEVIRYSFLGVTSNEIVPQ